MSGFNLPVRRLHGEHSGMIGGQNDPSRYSLLGEPLPEDHDDGPALGISVAAVIAAATIKANSSDSSNNAADEPNVNISNKKPFQLPIRRVIDKTTKTDASGKWDQV